MCVLYNMGQEIHTSAWCGLLLQGQGVGCLHKRRDTWHALLMRALLSLQNNQRLGASTDPLQADRDYWCNETDPLSQWRAQILLEQRGVEQNQDLLHSGCRE